MDAPFCYCSIVILAIVVFQFRRAFTVQELCPQYQPNGTTRIVTCWNGCCHQYIVYPCCLQDDDTITKSIKSNHNDFDRKGPQFRLPATTPPSSRVNSDDNNKVPVLPFVGVSFAIVVLIIIIIVVIYNMRRRSTPARSPGIDIPSNNPNTVSIENTYVPPAGNTTVVHNRSGNMVMGSNAPSAPSADILYQPSTAQEQHPNAHGQHIMSYEAPPPSYDEIMSRQSAV